MSTEATPAITAEVNVPRKLIEVALPLDRINDEAARRKRKAPTGYPTTLHKWWAQRPVAAVRAVLFSQLVNDPSWKWELEHPGEVPPNHLKATWAKSRKRLFGIIEELVKWPSPSDAEEMARHTAALLQARAEIRKSWCDTCEANRNHPRASALFNPERLPGFYDPFAGGGTIPMEAQRLGLEVSASDLNPVAVLINKAMIEIPPRFAGRAPVGPVRRGKEPQRLAIDRDWTRAAGLAEDVRRYGDWICARAQERLGHLYPLVEISAEVVGARPDLKPLLGKKVEAVAYLWARTVCSPNPAYATEHVPLVSTFVLSSTKGAEVWLEPVVEGRHYSFRVRAGATPPKSVTEGTKAGARGSAFRCLLSGSPIDGAYIKAEGVAGRLGSRLLAVVVSAGRRRAYIDASPWMEDLARSARVTWRPEGPLPARLTGGTCVPYGLSEWGALFTERQLASLEVFCDLLPLVRQRTAEDALASGIQGGDAAAYADAVVLLLAFAVDRLADYGCSLATWRPKDNAMRSALSAHALPMTWDFAEGSPFASSSSGFLACVDVIAKAVEALPAGSAGRAFQAAAQAMDVREREFVSTDPPYYANIAYADLSDFFYVWLRRNLRAVFPQLLSTIEVPKSEELVALPYRHGSEDAAEEFFLRGMTQAMTALAARVHPSAPLTIYYALKESETEQAAGTSSAGWETFLDAVLKSGLAITGTWPLRTEGDNRQVGIGANALASSILLVCRPRPANAPTTSRRAFLRELNQALPEALDEMTRGVDGERTAVAPVDLSQAIIGPGMAVFSKYSAVLEADGTPMAVRTALQLINRFLAEEDFDADTQFCLHWFEQNGWKEGKFGVADTLARAKGTSVEGVRQSGVVEAGGGNVRLLKWAEYPEEWDPKVDARLPIWEVLHQMIRLTRAQGEGGAGAVLAAVQHKAEAARQLAYRLYTLCERAGWAEDARAYNELVTSWAGIEAAAAAAASEMVPPQRKLDFGN